MITKPQGYDEAQAFTGEFASLPAGCYVCKILGAKQEKYNGHDRFIMQFDIAEGEQKDFYQNQYNLSKKTDQNTKYKGVHRQYMDERSIPYFKGLMTSIERSNPGFVFPWGRENNEKTLVGKKFGAVMGREEFTASDGEKRWATKIFQIRSIDGLKDAKVPDDKPLTDNAGATDGSSQYGQPDENGFTNIPDNIDEELPFM